MISDLTKKKLIDTARKASKNAYAPYSQYHVGAAVLVEDDTIIPGCNVENASYGLTNCAERTAIFTARCMGYSKFKAIAIYTPVTPTPMPCGACRQVMAEGGNNPLVIAAAEGTEPVEKYLSELLPYSFSL